MVYDVIISHEQTDYIPKFNLGNPTTFVLDDPLDSDISACNSNGFNVVKMPVARNRSANRNAGLKYVIEHYDLNDDDIIEFFDGDRVPTAYNRDAVCKTMQDYAIDCMLYLCENDKRNIKTIVRANGVTIVDTGMLCNPFYSCGFAMKYSAVKRICKNDDYKLFEESFNTWGCEDQFLGIMCDVNNVKVALTNLVLLSGNVGGDELSHNNYRDSLQQYVNLIMRKRIPIRDNVRPVEIIF